MTVNFSTSMSLKESQILNSGLGDLSIGQSIIISPKISEFTQQTIPDSAQLEIAQFEEQARQAEVKNKSIQLQNAKKTREIKQLRKLHQEIQNVLQTDNIDQFLKKYKEQLSLLDKLQQENEKLYEKIQELLKQQQEIQQQAQTQSDQNADNHNQLIFTQHQLNEINQLSESQDQEVTQDNILGVFKNKMIQNKQLQQQVHNLEDDKKHLIEALNLSPTESNSTKSLSTLLQEKIQTFKDEIQTQQDANQVKYEEIKQQNELILQLKAQNAQAVQELDMLQTQLQTQNKQLQRYMEQHEEYQKQLDAISLYVIKGYENQDSEYIVESQPVQQDVKHMTLDDLFVEYKSIQHELSAKKQTIQQQKQQITDLQNQILTLHNQLAQNSISSDEEEQILAQNMKQVTNISFNISNDENEGNRSSSDKNIYALIHDSQKDSSASVNLNTSNIIPRDGEHGKNLTHSQLSQLMQTKNDLETINSNLSEQKSQLFNNIQSLQMKNVQMVDNLDQQVTEVRQQIQEGQDLNSKEVQRLREENQQLVAALEALIGEGKIENSEFVAQDAEKIKRKMEADAQKIEELKKQLESVRKERQNMVMSLERTFTLTGVSAQGLFDVPNGEKKSQDEYQNTANINIQANEKSEMSLQSREIIINTKEDSNLDDNKCNNNVIISQSDLQAKDLDVQKKPTVSNENILQDVQKVIYNQEELKIQNPSKQQCTIDSTQTQSIQQFDSANCQQNQLSVQYQDDQPQNNNYQQNTQIPVLQKPEATDNNPDKNQNNKLNKIQEIQIAQNDELDINHQQNNIEAFISRLNQRYEQLCVENQSLQKRLNEQKSQQIQQKAQIDEIDNLLSNKFNIDLNQSQTTAERLKFLIGDFQIKKQQINDINQLLKEYTTQQENQTPPERLKAVFSQFQEQIANLQILHAETQYKAQQYQQIAADAQKIVQTINNSLEQKEEQCKSIIDGVECQKQGGGIVDVERVETMVERNEKRRENKESDVELRAEDFNNRNDMKSQNNQFSASNENNQEVQNQNNINENENTISTTLFLNQNTLNNQLQSQNVSVSPNQSFTTFSVLQDLQTRVNEKIKLLEVKEHQLSKLINENQEKTQKIAQIDSELNEMNVQLKQQKLLLEQQNTEENNIITAFQELQSELQTKFIFSTVLGFQNEQEGDDSNIQTNIALNLNQNLTSIQNCIEFAKSSQEALSRYVQEQQEDIQSLQSQLQSTQLESTNQQNQIKQLQNINLQLEQEILTQNQQKTQILQLENDNKDLNQQINHYLQEIQQLTSQISNLESNFLEQDQLLQIQANLEGQIKQYKGEINIYQGKVKSLESQYDNIQHLYEQKDKQLNDLQTKIILDKEQHQKQLDKIQQLNQIQQFRFNDDQKLISLELYDQLKDAEVQLHTLEQQLAHGQIISNQEFFDLKNVKQEKEKLEAELNRIQDVVKSQEQQISLKQMQIKELQIEFQELEHKTVQMQVRIEEGFDDDGKAEQNASLNQTVKYLRNLQQLLVFCSQKQNKLWELVERKKKLDDLRRFDCYDFNLTLHLYKNQLVELDRRLGVFHEMQLKANGLYEKLRAKAELIDRLNKDIYRYNK